MEELEGIFSHALNPSYYKYCLHLLHLGDINPLTPLM